MDRSKVTMDWSNISSYLRGSHFHRQLASHRTKRCEAHMPETSPVALLSGVSPVSGGALPSPHLLTEKQVATLLGVTTRTLQRWRVTGNGPAWVRVGPRMVRYSEAVMVEWAEGRTFAHRAAELAGGAA